MKKRTAIRCDYRRFRGSKKIGYSVVRNIPLFPDVYDAVSCIGIAYRYVNCLRDMTVEMSEAPIDVAVINRIIDGAFKDNRTFLLVNEDSSVLNATGVRSPQEPHCP